LLLKPRRQITAIQELHDHVGGTVLERPHVEHARDMLALDLDGGPRFPSKPADHVGVSQHGGQEELDRNLLVELQMGRSHDHAHAADAQNALDAVLPREDLALSYARCLLSMPCVMALLWRPLSSAQPASYESGPPMEPRARRARLVGAPFQITAFGSPN
jgi:hypothetical protein